MEVLTIVLASLLGLASPTGLVTEQMATRLIRQQLKSVEHLQVRIDNTPVHQLIQGKVDRVRLVGRGLEPVVGLRIDTLEVETDPINLNRQRLQTGKLRWQQPLNAGVRLVVRKSDLQTALRSPAVIQRLQTILRQLGGEQLQDYDLQNVTIDLLAHQRIRLTALLKGQTDQLAVQLETGVTIVAGHKIELVQPMASFNQTPLPTVLVTALSRRILDRCDLRTLEKSGIIARILHWQMDPDQLELATFVQVQSTLP